IDSVPTIGSSGTISSYRDAFRFFLHGEAMVKQGYDRYTGHIYRIPFMGRWNYVVSGADLIKDIGYTPEDKLSFDEAIRDQIQSDLTMGPELREDPHLIPAVLACLTRNLGRCFPGVRDEVVCAFDDILALEGTDWKLITIMPAMTDIVCRVSNRLFVGLPLCRDPDYLKLSIKHTLNVVICARLISMLPPILRPILGPLLSSRNQNMRAAQRLMGPLVAHRLEMFQEHGSDWPNKPNDLVSWLIDMAEPKQRNVRAIIQRVLVVVMAAIHTSSITFVQALLDLAAYPSYIEPLRDEVESVIKGEGWTKAALGDMHKIDSFLRESQRFNGLGILSMFRKVIHPDGFRFSDGTVLPEGSFVNVAVRAVHHDPKIFPDADVFDGFRFSKMRSEEHPGVFKHHMVTTEPTHLPFGHGKHACPGRFFAATELKAMLAHVVLNYDVRLEHEGARPADRSFATIRVPNRNAKVWFRKRGI
ncbi:cytochrome P450, partial [Mycena sp. CBHHK59/15]